ncbi:MAG: DUF1636 domain-containing protein [Pseudomonadota bacterium]
MSNGLTLSICLRCRDGRETQASDLAQRGGRRLATAVVDMFAASDAERSGIELRGVHCMSQCKRPCTIALSGYGRFTCLFGDLDPTRHAADVLSVAAAYASSANGALPRASRPQVLQAGILGRIPPIGFADTPVEPLSVSHDHKNQQDRKQT